MGFLATLGSMIPGISAGAGIAGGFASRHEANQAARRNREFQQNMSSTAHQREVKDLIAAGLNPILSAGGKGASTPMGGQKQVQDMSKAVSGSVSSAAMTANMMANIKSTNARARTEEVEAKLSQDMLDFYNKNSAVKEAVNAGMLSTRAGTPKAVSTLAAASSAFKKYVQGQKIKSTDPQKQKNKTQKQKRENPFEWLKPRTVRVPINK